MLAPGQMIGPYEILSPLGKGGMGEVFRAKDTRLEREVAIKILAGNLSDDAAAMSRFVREAKALAALSHSNIIAIHDFGTDQGISYAVMELLSGQTLRERIAASKIEEKEALGIAVEIANGLSAAHSAGVIHRDLKPENIFLTTDGGVKILDFGLARREVSAALEASRSAGTISQSDAGVVIGTVPYMSPEQVRGEKVDARTDIFSFGAILYEMLSGERLFSRKTSADTISAILNERAPELATSPEVNQIIQHCLEKNPDKRFQTARDLLFALKSTSSGTQVVHPSAPGLRKHTFVIASVGLIVLLAIGVSYFRMARTQSVQSLAVMPFVNGSGNADAEYLSNGITDSIIYSLSSLPKLRVMGRDTVYIFKGKQIDPRKIGRELNVQAVVTGTVVQQGNTLVIRANLINVADGSQLWGDQYNQTFADVLKIQSQISQQISENLQLKLTGEQKRLIAKHPTENPEAYRLYLKGQYHIWKNTEEDYEKARQYYQKALDLDPSFASAYGGMGLLYQALGLEGLWPPNEAWPKAEASLLEALRLDPSATNNYGNLGMIECMYKWDWDAAERNYNRMNEMSEKPFDTGQALCLLAIGRFDEAIDISSKGNEIQPLSRVFSVNYGQILMAAGQYNKAIEQLKKTIRLDPTFDSPHFALAQIYENKGMIREAITETIEAYHLQGNEDAADLFREAKDAAGYQEAKKTIARFELESLAELAKQKYVSPFEFARRRAKLNEKDEAFEWLEKAFRERSAQLIYIRVLNDFKNLRSDPRFADLVNRIGLPKT
jgi:non-specific serine/threonine protein kinase